LAAAQQISPSTGLSGQCTTLGCAAGPTDVEGNMTTELPTEGLFQLNPRARAGLRLIGGQIPVVFIDDVFRNPAAIREAALRLQFHKPPYPYPGKIAEPDNADPSLQAFLARVLELVNGEYLPRVPPIGEAGRPIAAFKRVQADFAITDIHPDELELVQRAPHVDPVPIFGLVYLNPVERGGTLFFNRSGNAGREDRDGYFVKGDAEYAYVGKIEAQFNRLAVYPGFVPHTGEIVGDWIRTGERFSSPRLTQRLVFFP
jgi:hypothetical protein